MNCHSARYATVKHALKLYERHEKSNRSEYLVLDDLYPETIPQILTMRNAARDNDCQLLMKKGLSRCLALKNCPFNDANQRSNSGEGC